MDLRQMGHFSFIIYLATYSDTLCMRVLQRQWIFDVTINPLTAKLFNLNFTHLQLCLADAIHNSKWVKIIQICQNGG